MRPKPKHLSPEYAAIFREQGVVDAYRWRPPYPAEAIEHLSALVAGTPRVVLDVGCGTGDIARRLAPLVDRLDAVDVSAGMIEQGKRLPGGDCRSLRWILSPMETAPLSPPYGLITAGESVHWMAWDVVFPRFAGVLSPGGVLAIVERDWNGPPEIWERERPIISRHSVNRDFQPIELVEELQVRGLFRRLGEKRTESVPWRPSVDEYIECRHSQNGLPRDRMPDRGAAFDAALRNLLEKVCREGVIELHDGRLELFVSATVVWGEPLPRLLARDQAALRRLAPRREGVFH